MDLFSLLFAFCAEWIWIGVGAAAGAIGSIPVVVNDTDIKSYTANPVYAYMGIGALVSGLTAAMCFLEAVDTELRVFTCLGVNLFAVMVLLCTAVWFVLMSGRGLKSTEVVLSQTDAMLVILIVLGATGLLAGYAGFAALTVLSGKTLFPWGLALLVAMIVAACLINLGIGVIAEDNPQVKGPGLFLVFLAAGELGLISTGFVLYSREAMAWQWTLLAFSSVLFQIIVACFPQQTVVNPMSLTSWDISILLGLLAAVVFLLVQSAHFGSALAAIVGTKIGMMVYQYVVVQHDMEE